MEERIQSRLASIRSMISLPTESEPALTISSRFSSLWVNVYTLLKPAIPELPLKYGHNGKYR